MIKVFTVPHTYFAATHLVEQLCKLGKMATIVDEIDYYDKSIYIIYNAAALSKLPVNYIVMQTEIAKSHWFNTHYIRTIRRALAVWDYSPSNIAAYYNDNKKIFIVTPGIRPRVNEKKDIDFLFYGWLKGSDRRNIIVKQIEKEIPLMVVTNKLKKDIWELLDRAKVVINVHYYTNSPLELYRINESLSHGCHVISEGYDPNYRGIVDFKEVNSISEAALLKSKKVFDYDLSTLDNTNQLKRAIYSTGIF